MARGQHSDQGPVRLGRAQHPSPGFPPAVGSAEATTLRTPVARAAEAGTTPRPLVSPDALRVGKQTPLMYPKPPSGPAAYVARQPHHPAGPAGPPSSGETREVHLTSLPL